MKNPVLRLPYTVLFEDNAESYSFNLEKYAIIIVQTVGERLAPSF